VVQVDNRSGVIESLAKSGVATGIHYPTPFYLQGGYRDLEYGVGSFPVTEKISSRILSLPMFPEITDAQIDYVVEKLSEAVSR
jgi:dTDP-4-amino-4,6-dideoxygalactose transaminase